MAVVLEELLLPKLLVLLGGVGCRLSVDVGCWLLLLLLFGSERLTALPCKAANYCELLTTNFH